MQWKERLKKRENFASRKINMSNLFVVVWSWFCWDHKLDPGVQTFNLSFIPSFLQHFQKLSFLTPTPTPPTMSNTHTNAVVFHQSHLKTMFRSISPLWRRVGHVTTDSTPETETFSDLTVYYPVLFWTAAWKHITLLVTLLLLQRQQHFIH